MNVINPGESATLLEWQNGTPFVDRPSIKINGGTPSISVTMIHPEDALNTALDQGEVVIEGSLDRKFWYPVASLNFGEMFDIAGLPQGGYVQANAVGELALDCNFVRVQPTTGIFARLGPGFTNITIGG